MRRIKNGCASRMGMLRRVQGRQRRRRRRLRQGLRRLRQGRRRLRRLRQGLNRSGQRIATRLVTWICGLIAKTKSGRASRTGSAVNEDTEGGSYFLGEEEERQANGAVISSRYYLLAFNKKGVTSDALRQIHACVCVCFVFFVCARPRPVKYDDAESVRGRRPRPPL
jgi:hypothetical protein